MVQRFGTPSQTSFGSQALATQKEGFRRLRFGSAKSSEIVPSGAPLKSFAPQLFTRIRAGRAFPANIDCRLPKPFRISVASTGQWAIRPGFCATTCDGGALRNAREFLPSVCPGRGSQDACPERSRRADGGVKSFGMHTYKIRVCNSFRISTYTTCSASVHSRRLIT